MLYARISGLPSTSRPTIVNWPFSKRNDASRVQVKLKSVSVQWWTLRTVCGFRLLMASGIVRKQGLPDEHAGRHGKDDAARTRFGERCAIRYFTAPAPGGWR